MLSCIFATDENGLIGANNALPWHLPADLKRFKAVTGGHSVIMGRLTYESILQSLGKPLPNRRNIVVSRGPAQNQEGVEFAASLGDALKLCVGDDEVFIIGGASVYNKAFELGIVQKVYWTLIHHAFEGDTRLDLTMWNEWNQVENKRLEPDDKNAHFYSFITLTKPELTNAGRRVEN
ncbi:MAG: dihydrofolate reductase [Bacteroidia bacterium]|nr:dihydrofolate reductase [Bacteroidia bacterium]